MLCSLDHVFLLGFSAQVHTEQQQLAMEATTVEANCISHNIHSPCVSIFYLTSSYFILPLELIQSSVWVFKWMMHSLNHTKLSPT